MMYFDHNATTPVLPAAHDAVIASMRDTWGNPSSGHAPGRAARASLDAARQSVAKVVNGTLEQITFTSGATEAINHAVFNAGPGRCLVSAVEHPAVRAALGLRLNREVEDLPVEEDGRVDPQRALQVIDAGAFPAFVALMAANNETGIIQPIKELAEGLRERMIPFLVDAVQYVGRIPIDFQVDYLVVTGHKIGGIKGAGALITRPGLHVMPFVAGGGQEQTRRGGTEPMPAIAALGAAMAHIQAHREEEAVAVGALRDGFEEQLRGVLPRIQIIGDDVPRIPNTSLVIFPSGVEAEALVNQLASRGVAASAGSACHTGSLKPSAVLTAMGLEPNKCFRAVRFSFGATNTAEEIERLVAMLPKLASKIRGR